MTPVPERGFTETEFERRCERVQRLMRNEELDAIILTTEPHVRYFSGFFTPFWLSPARPWFLVVPSRDKPVAVIPRIGEALMRQTWLEDIRTWPSPDPGDDGIGLLAATCLELPARYGHIGMTLGAQSRLRMPLNDFMRLRERLGPLEVRDCAALLHRVLSVKSPAEIGKIRHACRIVSEGFRNLPNRVAAGERVRDICHKLRIDLLSGGADETPYLVAGCGPGGYTSIIQPPGDTRPAAGDVLVIDTGTVFDGYYCDFDRNFGFEETTGTARRAYQVLYQATEAGIRAALPGSTTSDVYQAMWREIDRSGASPGDVGRMGHGFGMQLTEWPSITAGDATVLEPGMVLALEPAMACGEKLQMVHEENIVITESGAELLSERADEHLIMIGGAV